MCECVCVCVCVCECVYVCVCLEGGLGAHISDSKKRLLLLMNGIGRILVKLVLQYSRILKESLRLFRL